MNCNTCESCEVCNVAKKLNEATVVAVEAGMIKQFAFELS